MQQWQWQWPTHTTLYTWCQKQQHLHFEKAIKGEQRTFRQQDPGDLCWREAEAYMVHVQCPALDVNDPNLGNRREVSVGAGVFRGKNTRKGRGFVGGAEGRGGGLMVILN